MGTHVGLPDEMDPFLNQRLSRLVCRMRLASDNELYRALWITQQAQEPLPVVQQQVWSLIGCEAAREAQCQSTGIE